MPLYLLHGSACFVKGVSGKCYPYYSGVILIPFIFLIFYEKIRRLFLKEYPIKKMEIFNSGIRIEVDKSFEYKPGCYAYLNFPQFDNKFSFHPISISSCSSMTTETIEFSIKEVGIWSGNIKNLVSSNKGTTVKVDGPYFSSASKYINYPEAIFICSGIGITPFISIIKDSVMNYLSPNIDVHKKMTLIWTVRDRDEIIWFEQVIADIINSVSCDIIDIKIWLTEPVLDPEIVGRISDGSIPSYDTILGTNIHFNYNRPDFGKIFREYKNTTENVGVFVCGGEPIVNSVLNATKKIPKYNVIVENFAF